MKVADHDPDTTALLRELQRIEGVSGLQFSARVACTSFTGYGLYDRCIYPLRDFMDRLVHAGIAEGELGRGISVLGISLLIAANNNGILQVVQAVPMIAVSAVSIL